MRISDWSSDVCSSDLLNGLEEWEEGEVSIGGTPVAHRARDLRRLRREVGMVFQSFNLFPHLDALTNVTLAPRVVGRRRRTEAEQAGMALLDRSEEHTSELQSLMRISYAVFCLKKKRNLNNKK